MSAEGVLFGEGAVFVGVARCAVGTGVEVGVDGAASSVASMALTLWQSKLLGVLLRCYYNNVVLVNQIRTKIKN